MCFLTLYRYYESLAANTGDHLFVGRINYLVEWK